MRYYIGPWEWDSSNPLRSFWRPPAGVVDSPWGVCNNLGAATRTQAAVI